MLQKATDFDYNLDGDLVLREVTLAGTDETVTETWSYQDHWVTSYEVVSDAAPTKRFRTEYTFYTDGQGRPTNVKEVKRLRDDGTSFQTTLLSYNANGQLATITPPAVTPDDGLQVVRSYYAATDASVARRGFLEEESLADPNDPHLKRTMDYDARGFLASVTDARTNATSFTNDELGRVVEVTNALDESTRYTYTGPNAELADPNDADPGTYLARLEVGRTQGEGEGQVQILRWDDEGRMVGVDRKGDGGTLLRFLTYDYDSDDNRTLEEDAEGRETSFAYDPKGQLTSITDSATTPNTTLFEYDALGNRTKVTDALLRETVLVYDELERLIESQAHGSTADPISPALVTAFEYDAAGNVTKVIDPKDQETDYTYTTLSELTGVEQHLDQTVTYGYDPRGRLRFTTNARGHTLVYDYLPWGGLEAILHFPTALDAFLGQNLARTVSYGYDAGGNVTQASDTDFDPNSPALYTMTYDALDRPDEVTAHYVPGGDRTLEHGYDRFGNRSALTFTDGSDVLDHSWTYDKLDRLTEAQLADPNGLTFDYFANDDLQQITHGNGVVTDYTYLPEGPIDTITVTSPSEQLLKLEYAVDAVLNIDQLTEQHTAAGPTHLYDYGYDALDRLESASYPTALGLPSSESFEYDAAGNREIPGQPNDYDYDANNRITASPGKVWVYDDDGNPESTNAGLADEETFTYDFTNRMRGYTNAQTSTTASYLYDPFGRRIAKTVNGTTTWFLWDGDDLLAEFDGSGDRQRRYTYAGWVRAHGAGGHHGARNRGCAAGAHRPPRYTALAQWRGHRSMAGRLRSIRAHRGRSEQHGCTRFSLPGSVRRWRKRTSLQQVPNVRQQGRQVRFVRPSGTGRPVLLRRLPLATAVNEPAAVC